MLSMDRKDELMELIEVGFQRLNREHQENALIFAQKLLRRKLQRRYGNDAALKIMRGRMNIREKELVLAFITREQMKEIFGEEKG